MSDEAKAVEAIAKTTEKALDSVQRFGSFLARLVGGPLEQKIGIWEDEFKYERWERQVRLMERSQVFLAERGLERPSRVLPLSFALPLLRGALLEDDDYLQDMWARLLSSAADADSQVEVRRTFVTILENLAPLDALVLERIAAVYTGDRNQLYWTKYLPDRVLLERPEGEVESIHPAHAVEIAVGNLVRLGCLTSAMAWGGMAVFSSVHVTALGYDFIRACVLSPTAATNRSTSGPTGAVAK